MGKSLTAVGYWVTSLNDDFLFPPQEFVRTNLGAGVGSYLRSGEKYEQYRGYSWCRFQCGVPYDEMGSRDLTDGTWVWPEGLAHYVEAHSVNLPPRFVDHIASSIRTVANLRSQDDLVEFGFWEAWCRHNLSFDYFKRLGLARAETNLLAEQMLEGHFRDVEQKTGLSADSCIWAGCTNRALLGISFCARCASKMQPRHPDAAAYGVGLRQFLCSYTQI
jgi:hypothetical protein